VTRKRLEVTFENSNLEEIRIAMLSDPKRDTYERLKFFKRLYEGLSLNIAKQAFGISDKTYQNWIKRFNSQGVDGLISKKRMGRPRVLEKNQAKEIITPLVKDEDKYYSARKITGVIKDDLKIDISYRTTVRYLHEQNLSFKFPRNIPAQADKEKRELFIPVLQEHLNNPKNTVYFSDESGFEADSRPRKKWIMKGEKGTSPYFGSHIRRTVIGAVAPTTGKFFSLIMPHADTEVFQVFLDEFAKDTKDENPILVLDNASWHKAKSLNWHHIKPLYLPAYSPDFNPIERLWLAMKNEFFNNWHTKEPDKLEDRIEFALRFYLHNPLLIKSICKISSIFIQ
jgi:transposase